MKTKLLSFFCVAYVILVLYGSLMPFEFTNDSQAVSLGLSQAFMYWPVSSELHTSLTDVAANILLYIPMGLLVSTRLAIGRRVGPVVMILLALSVGAVVSFTVEATQLLEPARVCAINDLTANSIGALVGGIAGAFWGRRGWLSLCRYVRGQAAVNPIILAAWVLMFILFADAVYPYLPTLDVGDLKQSVKRTIQLFGAAGFHAHPWHYWLVMRAGVYAALTVLLAWGLKKGSAPRWGAAAFWTLAFAAAIEFAKLFIESRNPNPANVVFSACGVAAGALLVRPWAGSLSARGKTVLAPVLLTVYVMYLEWEPFNFSWGGVQSLRSRLPSGTQWLPLYDYAMQGRGEQVYYFVRSLALLAALTYAVHFAWRAKGGVPGRWSSAIRGALVAGFLGLALETGQFLLPSRIPSLTDVFCFAAGGAIGGLLAQRRQTIVARRSFLTGSPP
jgi:VanZ family protein